MKKIIIAMLSIFLLVKTVAIGNEQNLSMASVEQDLLFIHKTLLNNHPGIYNKQDPGFVIHLQNAFQDADKALIDTNTEQQKLCIITDFIKSFNDTHLGICYENTPINKVEPQHILKYDFQIMTLQNDIHWITLPTFQPGSLEQQKMNSIIDIMPTLRSDKIIVFDVRGNGGGNSSWGKKIVTSLFGDAYAKKYLLEANKNVYCDWRVSEDNIQYLTSIQTTFENNFGKTSIEVEWITKVLEGMQKAFINNVHLYHLEKNDEPKEDLSLLVINPVAAKIVVIIDNHCVSACLDFIDDLKAMNHPIMLVGKTTKADSIYMDIRTVNLPSGKGKFWFPMKVYRNRLRGNNVPYYPDIDYNGDMQDTEILQKYILYSCL